MMKEKVAKIVGIILLCLLGYLLTAPQRNVMIIFGIAMLAIAVAAIYDWRQKRKASKPTIV